MSEPESAAVKTPLVSIGLSVFNGEATLEEAIRSVQAQTQGDFELIICDGASGDRTPAICRDFAARDKRIRYHRSTRNLGHCAAYNHALGRARGRYFKWLLHEDRLTPSYLASLQRLLDEREDVLLCSSIINRIDHKGRALGLLESSLAKADSPSPSQRFAYVVGDPLAGVDFYCGMVRTAMLRDLHVGSFPGAERARLARLAMRGRLAQLPQVLQDMREPLGRSSFWHEVRGQSWSWPLRIRHWPLQTEYVKLVSQAPLDRHERLRCLGVLAQAWTPGYERVGPRLETLLAMARKAQVAVARPRASMGQLLTQRRRARADSARS
jgi:hypothetical protein